jgi:tRNA-guanine family transglycosylase
VHADEMLGKRLLTLHNLAFYQRLVARLREAVLAGDLGQLLRVRDEAAVATELAQG